MRDPETGVESRHELAASAAPGGGAGAPAPSAGPLHLELRTESSGPDSAIWRMSLRNASGRPVEVVSVGLGFRWRAPVLAGAALRWLRQGHQSWSFAGALALDDAGTPPFPSGPWLRSFHHATPEPPADRAGWHESDGVALVGVSPRGACCLVAVLESGRAFGVVYLRRERDGIAVEAEQRIERPLEPEESLDAEAIRAALGDDAARLLDEHAEAHGRIAGARTHAGFQAGWCTWYHFFHDVSEARFLANLEALAAARQEIPIELVQLDDGYQREVGDWLETNPKFPSGLAFLAQAVRDAGFRAGLWTAPFCAVAGSRLYEEHPEWLLAGEDGPLLGLLHPMWSPDGRVYVLDPSHPGVDAHLRRVFAELVDMGFSYLKLDFLYAVGLVGRAHDPRLSRAARVRRGLDAVRAGAGASAFLLGCGCPLGPAVGVVDGMRIGPDTGPHWAPLPEAAIPGLEPTVPSARNALRNTLARCWMHRRLWLNDPDCLLARSRETGLTPEQVRTLAVSIAVTGGMTIFSDDFAALAPADRALIRETLELARRVDRHAPGGGPRALDPLGAGVAVLVGAVDAAGGLLALLNPGDEPASCRVDLGEAGLAGATVLEPLLGSPAAERDGEGRISARLPAHGSALYRVASAAERSRNAQGGEAAAQRGGAERSRNG